MRAERVSRKMVTEYARELGMVMVYDTRGGYSIRAPGGTVGTPSLREALAFLRGYDAALRYGRGR